jgi:pilus assembly protein CpaF
VTTIDDSNGTADARPGLGHVPVDYYRQFGPIAVLLADDRVTEIMVNGTQDVYAEIAGQILLTSVRFSSEQELLDVMHRTVEAVGRRLDEENPICDARLADGSRVHAAIRPVATKGPYLTIRKFSRAPLTGEHLVGQGSASSEAMAFLKAAVESRTSILISGGASTGKTTLLNILSGFIPANERIVTAEDAAELQLRQRNVVTLETRPRGADSGTPVTVRDLVIASLRMRPDRIIVGECRGQEALDMLQAMNTGHEGSMTTVHANSPRDAISRLETMVLMAGFDLPARAIRRQIASAIHLFVHLERARTGRRRLVQITEVTGMEDDTISMQDLFLREPVADTATGDPGDALVPTGLRPRTLDRAAALGVPIPHEIAVFFPGAARAGSEVWAERAW